MQQTVCVLGLGYIGLPTASFLATKGCKVTGVDVSSAVVDTINRAEVHIVEPELDVLVRSAVHSGNLTAQTEPAAADVFFITVPTPVQDDRKPDLSYVRAASRAIAPFVEPGNLVILESTCPIGTTEDLVVETLIEEGVDVERGVLVAHCPERVLPGRILTELVQNDRIVGGINEESTKAAAEFYRLFVSGEVFETSARVAEMAKLTENTFRDVNIALANELSIICDKHDIDVWELIRLANRHPRVDILKPGPGVGGHCIAVDPWFVVASAPEQARLIRTAREVNDAKPAWVIDKVKTKADRFKHPTIACLGLAFKADVDDLRQSPAFDIVRGLERDQVGRLLVCEPNIRSHPDFELATLGDALAQADIILLLVDHKEFKALNPHRLQDKIIIDTRGVL
ncbi:MAG: UDP-N-acetyl-D-mannosamine dehydrogenase [Geminicoccaceae bacterium]